MFNIYKQLALSGLSVCCSVVAIAQEAPTSPSSSTPADSDGLQEIIITAQKRSENIMTAPVAITAISAETLSATGISSSGDLKFVTPGLTYDEGDGFPEYYIRGVGADFTQPGVSGSVALYIDGIYQNLSQSSTTALLDVDRVEVLKGPQGTLYGRNSTAGAINIYTLRPSTDGLQVKAVAGAQNFGGQSVAGYISAPLIGHLSGSFSATEQKHNSYVENIAPGQHFSDQNQYGERGKLLYVWDNKAEAEFAVWYLKNHDDGDAGFNQLQADSTGAAYGLLTGGLVPSGQGSTTRDVVDNDFPAFFSARSAGTDLHIKVPLTGFDLVSLTGYQDIKDNSGVDFDGTSAPVAYFYSTSITRTFSQELQFVSSSKGPLQWVGGLYGFYNYGAFDHLNVPAGETPTNTIYSPQEHIYTASRANAYAAYAQGSYKFGPSERWRATLGSRYSFEKARLDPANIVLDGVGQVAAFPKQSKNFYDFSPKGTLDYSTDNSLTYATISKGFKSGAYNLSAPSPDSQPVDPETLISYELGYKLTFAHDRVRLESAIFDYDYKNLQVQTIAAQAAPTTLSNAKKAAVRGLELEMTARPIRSFQINSGLSWLEEHKYKEFPNGVEFVDNGFGNTAVPKDVSGNRMSHSPTLTENLGGAYTIDVPIGDVQLSSNLYHSSSYFYDPSNDSRNKQNPYTTVNAKLAWRNIANRWSITLWANNLTNEQHYGLKILNTAGILGTYADPRTFGFTVGYTVE